MKSSRLCFRLQLNLHAPGAATIRAVRLLKGADLPRGEGKKSPKACLVLRLRFDKDKHVLGGWRRSRERREKAKVLAAFAALKDEGTEGYVASGKRG